MVNQDKDKSRRERLKAFFSNDPESWEDLLEEMNLCLSRAEGKLKAFHCEDRNYYAGKCAGVQEIIDIDKEFI